LSCVTRLILTEAQRTSKKGPLGELVTGTPEECSDALKHTIAREKPRLIILVGDTVSRTSVQSGIRADVIVVDNKEKRSPAVKFTHPGRTTFTATNPPGTIDTDAWKAVEAAISKPNSLVVVNGEEDLLTLVAILAAPTGSLVVYGQPGQGIVIVRVTHGKKSEVRLVLNQMDRVE